jgi:hypothetical protein
MPTNLNEPPQLAPLRMIPAAILMLAGMVGIGLYGVSFAAGNGRYDMAGAFFGYPLLVLGGLWLVVEFVTDLVRPKGS